MTRRYCGRSGIVLSISDGATCPECGSTQHHEVEPGKCGAWAPCPSVPVRLESPTGWWTDSAHGHPCDLEPGHDGPHATATCEE